MIILAELSPLDPVGGTRILLRATNANHRDITGLNSVKWRPAISGMPTIGIRLFSGDFDGTATPAGGNMTVQIDQLLDLNANARRFVWQGAPINLYAGTLGQAWPWTQVFQGRVASHTAEKNAIKLTFEVDQEPFKKDVLTAKYAGTAGAEGGADLKNRVKPLLLGRCLNAEPVLINVANSVFQFSAYGTIQAVNVLYERGSSFGASFGDYASYATLVAASIPPGRWATSLAVGMVRLGAPPVGVITGDVDGDKPSGTWLRKTGEIINRIATLAGVSGGLIDSTSLTALDTALNALTNQGRMGYYLEEQTNVLDLSAKLAAPCNAQAGVSMLGKLFVSQIAIGSPSITMDAQQRQLPRVVSNSEQAVSPPFSFIQLGYQPSWRVHTFDEISFYAQLIETGDYDAATTYREGNIVFQPLDGKRYLYINPTPTAGNAPPNVTYWSELQTTGGILTERFPTAVPTQMPLGSIYIDATAKQFRFEGNPLLSIGVAITSISIAVTDSGYVDIQDTAIPAAATTANWPSVVDTTGTKPVDNADVTTLVTGTKTVVIACDYLGAVKAGQLPLDAAFKLINGAQTDITTSASWAAVLKSGTATFTPTVASPNATGILNITAMSLDAVIEMQATYSGKVRVGTLTLPRLLDAPPGSGTITSTSTISQTTSASYGAANTAMLTATAGAGGQVACSFPATFKRTTNGSNGAFGKWQWRVVSGSYADITTEIASSANNSKDDTVQEPYNNPGSISVSMTKTGLTPGTPYEFQLLLRNDDASTNNWLGTASVAGS